MLAMKRISSGLAPLAIWIDGPYDGVLQRVSRLRKRSLAHGLYGVVGRQLRRLAGGCLAVTHRAANGKDTYFMHVPCTQGRAWENMALNTAGAASSADSRMGALPLESTITRSTTARSGTSMAVTYSGSASVHHSSDTNTSSAAQLRFSGASSKIGAAAHVDKA